MTAKSNLFNHIVVILESASKEDRVLKRAIQLARLNNGKLTLFRSLYGNPEIRKSNTEEQRQALLSAHRQQLAQLAHESGATELVQDTIISWQETIPNAIGNLCNSTRIDLIIKNSGHQLQLRQLLARNKDNFFIADCPAPVWLVKEREWDNNLEVLVGVDMGDDSIENHHMNRKILATGDELAKNLNAELHVVDCYFGEIGNMHFDYNNKRGFKRVATIREQHSEKLKLYINEYALSDDSLHFETGIPDDAIPEKAQKLGAEVAIIGNNEDSNMFDRLFGDTAKNSSRPCPAIF